MVSRLELAILTGWFIFYGIFAIVLPMSVPYKPTEISGILVGYNDSGDLPGVSATYRNFNEMMTLSCQIWKSGQGINISKIRFWMLKECILAGDFLNISIFLSFEIIIFFIFVVLLVIGRSNLSRRETVVLYTFLLTWLCSITLDLQSVRNHSTMDKFTYVPTWSTSGSTHITSEDMNVTMTSNKFADQYSLLQNVCDARKYFINSQYFWFLSFDHCIADKGVGDIKIVTIILKTVSMVMLLVLNWLVRLHRQADYVEVKDDV